MDDAPATETYVVDLATIQRPATHGWIYDAFRLDDDSWEGRGLYADETQARDWAASDYAEEEFGDNPVPAGALEWRKQRNGDWRLFDTTQAKYASRGDTSIVVRKVCLYGGKPDQGTQA